MLSVLFPEKTQWDGRLFDSPWPLLGIMGVYLYFVLRAGPRMMANKPPYSLRGVVLGYNAFIVLASLWSFIKMTQLANGELFTIACRPDLLHLDRYDGITDIGHFYFLSKLVELLDTVFFVLRKKFNQVSFLHVYHHTNIALVTWAMLRAVPACQTLIVMYSNTFVHILMYSYYFLSALGPAVQRYLWWKKYLTMVQMIQFLIMISFIATLLLHPGCKISKEILIPTIFNALTFLVLFLSFYTKSYSKKESKLQ